MLEKLMKTDEATREEWLECRRQGIGGSEAAIIVGLNRFGSPLRLWADKHGLGGEAEETEVMRQGTDFEEYVARRWITSPPRRRKCRPKRFRRNRR